MKRIARFEKVSFDQFAQGWGDTLGITDNEEIKALYDAIRLPRRATAGSAGYDFFAPADITLRPGETIKVPTGIRVWMEPGMGAQMLSEKRAGLKYRLQLNNTVGIIDSDYYYSDQRGTHLLKDHQRQQ